MNIFGNSAYSRGSTVFVAVSFASFTFANSVVNGDFEANGGSLDGWTITAPGASYLTPSHVQWYSSDTSALYPSNFTASETTGTLSQTFAPIKNISELDFYAWSDNQTITVGLTYTTGFASFDTLITAAQQGNGQPNSGWQYVNLLGDVDSSKVLTGVSFTVNTGGFENGELLYLDNVNVTGQAVPEPGTWFGFGSGLLFVLRRRRARVA